MKNLFTKYGYAPDKESVDRSLNLIAQNLEKVVSNDVLKECFSIMDLTSLSTTDTVASITALTE